MYQLKKTFFSRITLDIDFFKNSMTMMATVKVIKRGTSETTKSMLPNQYKTLLSAYIVICGYDGNN